MLIRCQPPDIGAIVRGCVKQDFSGIRPALPGVRVATLGPDGTDAHAEAMRLEANVHLCDSFPEAMAYAEANACLALVAAGYLDLHAKSQATWVDLHFSFLDRLRLHSVWESPTKEMCVAVQRGRHVDLDTVRSVALHASTRSLVTGVFDADVDLQYVRAKPLAVQRLASGEVDACVGSVDVVNRHGELDIVESFSPSMVWCLYGALTSGPEPCASADLDAATSPVTPSGPPLGVPL